MQFIGEPDPMPDQPEAESIFDTLHLHGYLDRMQTGNQEAANDLLRKVCVRMERLARRMLAGFPGVRRAADTDDVLQSALLRLLRSLEAVRPESTRDFFNLAAVHIRRELLDLARHYRRRPDVPAGGEHAEVADVAAPRDDLDRWATFHERVEQLPAREREVVGLIFYHGWSQAEIASLFQVDERTVRRRWQSACLRLNEALGELPSE
jgi:RNA polymerase sigma factor (sigma-70 family)